MFLNKNAVFYRFLDWLLKMIGYCLILIVTSMFFKNTLYIDNSCFGIWVFLAATVVYLLNRTLKPILVWLTIPITGITLGLFYPFINLIILKVVSFILGNHFDIYGIWYALFASILISVLNVLMDMLVFDKLKERK